MFKYIFGLFAVFIVIILGLSFYFRLDDLNSCGVKPDVSEKCKSVDAIVAISGGDTKSRTDEAIKLYENGWAKTLIFSGAAQDKTGPSNAIVMKEDAIKAGVPESAIFIDEYAATTKQNAINSQSIFAENDIKSVILVTSGYHQRRASLEFNRHTENVSIINHSTTSDSDWSSWWFISPRGWWLSTNEIAKIVVYYIEGLW